MPLRWKLALYLAAIHAALGAVAFLALRDRPAWLLAAEALFVLSLALGWLLLRAFSVPLRLIRTGAELVAEQDFGSTFRPVGQPEMDELISVYNRMIAELRTERLRLQEQHHFLDQVLQASPLGVLTLDFEGCVSDANPSAGRLLGAALGELAGRPVTALPSPLGPELDALAPESSRVVAAGSRRVKLSRGELYDRGFPRSFFLVEELTEELRASEKAAYEKLIRIFSHEVNNSLTPVLSLLETLREERSGERTGEETARTVGPAAGGGRERPPGAAPGGGPGPEADPELGRAIEAAIHRLDHLRAFMQGYAEVVRLPPPERRPCDVATLVDEILDLLRPELARRRIRWRWDERAEHAPVSLDRNQVEQVLVNVLRNAMEAIGEDGWIHLSLATAQETAAGPGRRPALIVRDTGPGLPPDVQGRLFTPFFSTKKSGRGLGLTLAQEILTQHGFGFRLENHPGGGATFSVQF